MSNLDAFAQRQSIEEPQDDFNPDPAYSEEENENWQQISDEEGKDSDGHALKLLQTDKARIEWSTGNGVTVVLDI
jgi:hypothetical protein